MAVSTLSITRSDIKTDVRRYLQYALTGTLETDQSTNLDRVIELGENMFYKGTVLPGEQSIHSWSFLKRLLTVAVVISDDAYNLDDDFGGFVDNYLTYDVADNAGNVVEILELAEFNRQKSLSMTTAAQYPLYAAVNNRARDQTTEQRWELLLWPSPSADQTLYGQIYSNPSAITDGAPYPLGGQPHGLTLLQACLAAAELYMNDGVEGVQMAQFLRMMRDSVALDRARTTPPRFGQNLDRSGYPVYPRRHLARGVIYDP